MTRFQFDYRNQIFQTYLFPIHTIFLTGSWFDEEIFVNLISLAIAIAAKKLRDWVSKVETWKI